jgi:hypothetical protein
LSRRKLISFNTGSSSENISARERKTWWQSTVGCATAVCHLIAPTRGKCELAGVLDRATPKARLSDRLAAQRTHAEAEYFCVAHLICDSHFATIPSMRFLRRN